MGSTGEKLPNQIITLNNTKVKIKKLFMFLVLGIGMFKDYGQTTIVGPRGYIKCMQVGIERLEVLENKKL